MGFDIDIFLDPVSNHLICTICQLPLKNAASLCAEGHTFCQECASEWASSLGRPCVTCPTCRRDVDSQDWQKNRIADDFIGELSVRCLTCCPPLEGTSTAQLSQRVTSSCRWTGKHSELVDHLGECPFAVLECPWLCGEILQRCDLEEHTASCCKQAKKTLTPAVVIGVSHDPSAGELSAVLPVEEVATRAASGAALHMVAAGEAHPVDHTNTYCSAARLMCYSTGFLSLALDLCGLVYMAKDDCHNSILPLADVSFGWQVWYILDAAIVILALVACPMTIRWPLPAERIITVVNTFLVGWLFVGLILCRNQTEGAECDHTPSVANDDVAGWINTDEKLFFYAILLSNICVFLWACFGLKNTHVFKGLATSKDLSPEVASMDGHLHALASGL